MQICAVLSGVLRNQRSIFKHALANPFPLTVVTSYELEIEFSIQHTVQTETQNTAYRKC